jgi:para-nitrobenzyl esterase
VPLIIGTTLDDAGFLSTQLDLTEDDLRVTLDQRWGEKAGALLALYRTRRPHKSPYLLLGEIITDAGFRRHAHIQAERKAAVGKAPVHVYQWNWASPAYEGVYGAAHAVDVPASFHNLHDPLLIGATREAEPLAEALSSALVAFARSGVPTADGLADWPAFTEARRATLIFDDGVKLVNDPDPELRAFWETLPVAATVFG